MPPDFPYPAAMGPENREAFLDIARFFDTHLGK
jgi:hypothetical protein